MILVTGHLGMIGSRLTKKLGNFVGIDIKDGHNLITCELPKDIHLIYHLAAQSSVEASWHDPVHDMDNIRMTARLVKEYPNTKIVYANSAASQEPIMSPYGFSKKVCGDYLKTFHKQSVICVFPNVYGEVGGKSVVDIFKNKDTVTVFGDGEQIRDYVHVDDIVDGLVLAKDWDSGEYFMGSTIPTTVLALAEGKNIVSAPARKEARECVLPNTTPNWTPKVNVHDYLKS